ncbi:MAG TPA: MerR family transcriptional regulator [Candidatus Dormibacteraeota bacterium]
MDRLLGTGAFARRSRLSMKALRLYDRLGLLIPAHVDRDSHHRRYRESQLETARLILHLRRLDMPLAQVARVLAAPGDQAAELVESYWEGVERRLAGQRELAAHLRIRLAGGEGRFDAFDVRQRDMPEQIVLTEQRHVRIEELAGWIETALGRLRRAARDCGGPAGWHFVVFHGEVNEDSDGPVEICVPIDAAAASRSAVATRREPAHREAYVRLRKAGFEFPQILSAYDAVAHWAGQRGLALTGPPREVYLADVASASATDEVCDVAHPVA